MNKELVESLAVWVADPPLAARGLRPDAELAVGSRKNS